MKKLFLLMGFLILLFSGCATYYGAGYYGYYQAKGHHYPYHRSYRNYHPYLYRYHVYGYPYRIGYRYSRIYFR